MNNPEKHPLWHRIVTPKNGRLLSIITLILVTLFIPLSVYVTQQEQDIRQEAAKKKQNKKDDKKDKQEKKDDKQEKRIDKKEKKEAKIVKANERKAVKSGDVPGTILVKYKKGVENTESASVTSEKISKKHKGKERKKLKRTRWREIEVPQGKEEEIMADLRNDPNVELIEQDAYASVLAKPNDPLFTEQWGIENTGQDIKTKNNTIVKGVPGVDANILPSWDITKGKSDITIAVLDTGIDSDHPDLSGKVIQSDEIFSNSDTEDDIFGHGTHVAGIIAANTDNDEGIAGVCPECKVVNIKVMNDVGEGQVSWIAQGIEKAIDMNVDVINLSVGTPENKSILEDAVNAAWNAGILVVAAAGNCGSSNSSCPVANPKTYPAYYQNSISVGALNNKNEKPGFSNYGQSVDITAPGDAIVSTYKGGTYAIMNGTSMASPMVAGIAGLLLATGEYPTVTKLRSQIESMVTTTGNEGTYWTYGRVNAGKALASQANPTQPATQATATPKPTTQSTPTPANDSNTNKNKNKNKNKKNNNNKNKKASKKSKNRKKNRNNNNPPATSTITSAIPSVTITEPPTLTPTPDPLAANVELIVYVVGIGKTGDRTNTGIPGNQSPASIDREFILEIIGADNKPLQTVSEDLEYDPSLGGYKGTIPVGNIQSGEYLVNVSSIGTLKKQSTSIVNLSQTKTTRLPDTTLITGDITGDNAINILDFNILAGCYSEREPAKSCNDSEYKEAADFNDDGAVDGFDYNLFIRNLMVLRGS